MNHPTMQLQGSWLPRWARTTVLLFVAFFNFSNCQADLWDFSYSSSGGGRSRYYGTPRPEIISLELNPQNILNSSFRIAAREERLGNLKALLALGAEINSQSDRGESALSYAARRCSSDTVAFLLEQKAEVNIRDFQGRTPLIFAIRESCAKTVKLLLGVPGIDLKRKDHRGQTALDYAKENRLPEVGGPAQVILELVQKAGKSKLSRVGQTKKLG